MTQSAENGTPAPVPKYRLTLVIEGNSHDEVEGELLSMTRGGYLLDTDYYKRDSCHVVDGRRTVTLEHQNPDMTPERYDAELSEWFDGRRKSRPIPPEGGAA